MATMRIDEERWKKLTKKELEISVEMGRVVRKSSLVYALIDNYLDDLLVVDGHIGTISDKPTKKKAS